MPQRPLARGLPVRGTDGVGRRPLGLRRPPHGQAIFAKIHRELEAHAEVEEALFYPAVKQIRSEEVKDLVREATEEHQIVKTLLAEIAAMSAQEEQYDAKVTVLKESVEHHVQEEEGEMFPAATKHLSQARLDALGAEMATRKEALTE
jgi:iron-sulfur cluster repair protein YtfE (RIC family)